MTYALEFSEDAERHLSLLGARQRAILLDSLEVQLAHQPTVATRQRKLLRVNPLAAWELRVGHLRVFYNVEDDQAIVIIVAIGTKVRNVLLIEGKEYIL